MPRSIHCVLAVLFCFAGYGALYLDAAYITHPWSQFEFEDNVTIWLSESGLDGLAGFWMLVWMHIPEWVISFAAGLVSRLSFRTTTMVICAVSFCVGFVLIPQIQFIADPDVRVFGATVIVGTFIWNLLCFPIAVLGGALPIRRRKAVAKSRIIRFSITRLLLVTLGFAATFFAVLNSRLLILPCLLLGFLIVLAYTTLRLRWAAEFERDPTTTNVAEP